MRPHWKVPVLLRLNPDVHFLPFMPLITSPHGRIPASGPLPHFSPTARRRPASLLSLWLSH